MYYLYYSNLHIIYSSRYDDTGNLSNIHAATLNDLNNDFMSDETIMLQFNDV